MASLISIPAPADPQGPKLPHNVEAEAAMLGAMMIDNRLADDLIDKLDPAHFFEPVHGRIFAAIKTLRQKDLLATPVTLRPMFEGDEGMRALGGPAYLAQLTGSGAGLIGARDFAEQIIDLAMLRTLVSVGRGLVERAVDTSKEVNPRKQIELAEEELFKVAADGTTDSTVKTFGQAATLAVKMAERAHNAGGGLSGTTTGFDSLNAKLGGLHKSDLVIVAGRPGMGKSSLASNIAFNAAARWQRDMADGIAPERSVGTKVALFNLEMSADQIATRILAEQSRISSEKLRKGEINQAEFNRLVQASIELQNLPLFIDDTAGISISALHTRMRRLQRRHNNEIGLVIVDYLQLLSGSSRGGGDNRVQEISEISRGLKTMAKDLNVCVMALSQLSRAVESREDKRPQLSDLRESGSIEQDADMVWFIYREDYYLAMQEPTRTDANSSAEAVAKHAEWSQRIQAVEGLAELVIAKQRHGATGKVTMHFNSEFTLFSDYAGPAPAY
ncbi:MAG: replicative DNA helicase [Sphingomonas sp.]